MTEHDTPPPSDELEARRLAVEHFGQDLTDAQWEEAYLGTWDKPREWAESILTDMGCYDELSRVLEASHLPDDVARYVDIDADGYAQDQWLSGYIVLLHRDDGRVAIVANVW